MTAGDDTRGRLDRYQRQSLWGLHQPVCDELALCGLSERAGSEAAKRVVARLDQELPRMGRRLYVASPRWLVAAIRYQQYQRALARALAQATARLLDTLDATPHGSQVAAAAEQARDVLTATDALDAADTTAARLCNYPGPATERGRDAPPAIAPRLPGPHGGHLRGDARS